jgi:hypothetical protein
MPLEFGIGEKTKRQATRARPWLRLAVAVVAGPPVTPAFLAPNKTPTKSRVFSKPFPLSSFTPFETPLDSFPLGARATNPAGTARTRAIAHACRPNAAVGHVTTRLGKYRTIA